MLLLKKGLQLSKAQQVYGCGVLASSRHLTPIQVMVFSTGLKGDYFKKASDADNSLPEEFNSANPSSSDGEDK